MNFLLHFTGKNCDAEVPAKVIKKLIINVE
jgi:hypothetical protein